MRSDNDSSVLDAKHSCTGSRTDKGPIPVVLGLAEFVQR